MTNVVKHKGYYARVEFDADDRVFFGRIAGIEDGISFHSDTVDGLIAAFEEAVDDYLQTCERVGKAAERPYSGTVYLRVDPSTHAEAAIAAALAGMSLNQFGEEALQRATRDVLPA
jgi:predicted HicB family RNase H-like nuclease